MITGRTILLNGGIIDITDGAHLQQLMESAAVDADGTATFQIPMFFDSEGEPKQFTTLRPQGDAWVLSRAVFDVPADTPITPAELAEHVQAWIDEGAMPQVLAFGVLVEADNEVTLRSVSFAGDTYFFTAEPEVPEAPEAPGKDPAAPAVPVQKPAAFTG